MGQMLALMVTQKPARKLGAGQSVRPLTGLHPPSIGFQRTLQFSSLPHVMSAGYDTSDEHDKVEAEQAKQ
jgi:hypothetical protein